MDTTEFQSIIRAVAVAADVADTQVRVSFQMDEVAQPDWTVTVWRDWTPKGKRKKVRTEINGYGATPAEAAADCEERIAVQKEYEKTH